MCSAQYERMFSQAATQLCEEEWLALFDFAFPQSRRLRAFHVWRLSRPCGSLIPIDFEVRNQSVSSSSMGMSSSCSLTVTSPLSPLTQSFGASQSLSFNDMLSRAVTALESCGPQKALAIFRTYLPERYTHLWDLLPALQDELEEASSEDGEWVMVMDDQTCCGSCTAQEQSPCQATYSMASTVMRLIQQVVADPEGATPQLQVYAGTAFQRLCQQHLRHTDSLLLPLHSLCTSSRGGALIFRTSDKRLILKQITEAECNQLTEMAEDYVAHVLANPSTLLCLIFGCFGYLLNGRYHYFVLAENSYPPDAQVDVLYDLKGSSADRSVLGRPRRCSNRLHRRSQQMCVDPLLALKDNDLQCPLELPTEACRRELKDRLHADSHFLMRHGVFDYSLLVAVSYASAGQTGENSSPEMVSSVRCLSDGSALRLKIVDFLTPWNVSLRLGGVALLQLPTFRSLGYLVTRRIISEASTMPPALYQERFVRRVMEKFTAPTAAV
eukprot:GGOE01021216.1.p1 GENE.GGOE01021216.1~~GGOE01021216.1.p1  ORF type:complete len:497 (-),score=82.07 GGOE01021216.1:476-1966(-)